MPLRLLLWQMLYMIGIVSYIKCASCVERGIIGLMLIFAATMIAQAPRAIYMPSLLMLPSYVHQNFDTKLPTFSPCTTLPRQNHVFVGDGGHIILG